ncbi:MAG TPA: cobalamin biosynthesis protein CobD [Phycisphaerales bacterium]|nr:cobalamin biosynthesis protein CobD [Phycisphaerales bacterium]
MRLEYQILAAVVLDGILGDPRWLPHPVRGIGWLASQLEGPARRMIRSERLAGIATALAVIASAGGIAWGLVKLTGLLHPLAADAVSVVLIYASIAARDLARHSMAVFRAMVAGDLEQARRRVAMMVGRDTDRLDESGVVRAAVESVAEGAVDGVAAPLLYALLAGPAGAIAYRAINTLDSTFGYTTDRYLRFGWASARTDDLANLIPARVTAPLMCLAAALLGERPLQALRTLLRDGRKHASPNAGLPEAAMAGALGVQLGGRACYDGQPVEKPTIGQPLVPLAPCHIRRANALMFVTTGLLLALGMAVRSLVIHLWSAWSAAA